MKKFAAILLVVSLLLSSFSVTFADDYRDQVLSLLADEYQVSAETIYLEGSLVDLPMTGEQFWVGRYSIGDEPADKPVVDDPDAPVSSGDLSAGVVYLRVKNGDLLTDDQAQPFFEEEEKLRQEEIEELARQSGKIDPYFYRKIIAADSGELFEAIIWLKHVETASMKAAMEEIMQEYPEFEEKLIPPEFQREILPVEPGGFVDPGDTGDGISGRIPDDAGDIVEPERPASGHEKEADEEYRILPYPEPETLPLPKEDIIDEPGIADDIDWARYEEMMNRLVKVYARGFEDSLAELKKTLNEMGAVYEAMEGSAAVRCELTAEQLELLKEADYIESISEDLVFYAMDGGMERAATTLDMAGGEERESAYLWVLAPVLLLAGGGGFYYYQRKRKLANDNS